MQVNKCLYLAGPMSDLTWDEANAWRDHVTVELAKTGVDVRSPLRNKELGSKDTFQKMGNPEKPNLTPRSILLQDYHDVDCSSALLVNFLGSESVSIGTVSEIARAYTRGIPVVVVMEPDNIHYHAFIDAQATAIFPTLDEGIVFTKRLFNI